MLRSVVAHARRESSPRDAADANSSRFPFTQSWVADDVWVSGLGDLSLHLGTSKSLEVTFEMHHAIVSMKLSANRTAATEGTISGIVSNAQAAEELKRIAGRGDPSLCQGSVIDSLANQVKQAADIMLDGRVGTKDETCNGISVGLGFEARMVQLGEVQDVPTPPDPCSM